jgi:hypothetical protein
MEAFLPSNLVLTFGESGVQRLRLAFVSFLRVRSPTHTRNSAAADPNAMQATEEALALNKTLIDAQQLTFQQRLQEGFDALLSLARSFGIFSNV